MNRSDTGVVVVIASLCWIGLAATLPRIAALAVGQLGKLTRREQRLFAILLLAALALRLLTPGTFVEVFTGYGLIGDVMVGAPPPKYGAGHAALLAPLFALVGPDDRTVFLLHEVLGTATIALVALWAGAWLAGTGTTTAILAVLASLPLLVRHHGSEAATVAATFPFVCGVFLAWHARRQGLVRDHLGAAIALACAAHVRPEFVPASVAVLWAFDHWPEPDRAAQPRFGRGAAWTLWGLLVAPQVLHLAQALQAGLDRGDLPTTRGLFVLKLPIMLVTHNLALWPHAFPLAVTLAGLWVLWRERPGRTTIQGRFLRWFAVVALAQVAPALTDAVVVSLPRLEAPALLLWAALATGLAWQRWGNRLDPKRLVLVASLVLLSEAATLPWLYARDNADEEALLWDRAALVLAGQRGTLHVLGYDDPGADKVSRHTPFWRFGPPHGHIRVRPLRELPPADAPDGEPRWILLNQRCFARQREPGTSPPASFEHEACRLARQRPDLTPVLELQAPNRGDVHFPWWPAQATLPVGLYRLQPRQVL